MRVITFLAQFAVVNNGQLTVVNGAFDQIAQGFAFSVVSIVYVGWDETNVKHELRYELLDANGQPVSPGPGAPPLAIALPFEVGRPPGVTKGMTLQVPQALNLGGQIAFPPGRYEWRVTVDGNTNPDWGATFQIGQPTQQAVVM